MPADDVDGGGNLDGFQGGAAGEHRLADALDGVGAGPDDALQAGTAGEGAVADVFDGGGDGDRGQGLAAVEGGFLDFGELQRIRNEYASNDERIKAFDKAFEREFSAELLEADINSKEALSRKNWLHSFLADYFSN